MYEWLKEDRRCPWRTLQRNKKPHQVADLALLEKKTVPRWVQRKFYPPLVRTVASREGHSWRHLKESAKRRHSQRKREWLCTLTVLTRTYRDILGFRRHCMTSRKTLGDLKVGEHAALELPRACTADTLFWDPAPTENTAALNGGPDRQPRRSTRDCHVPAWMGDVLSGRTFDNALPLQAGF